MGSETNQDKSSFWRGLVLWLVGVALCAGLGFGKTWQDSTYRRIQSTWSQGKAARESSMKQIARDVRACMGQSRDVVETKFPQFHRVGAEQRQEPLNRTMVEMSDGAGIAMQWFFRDGTFVGAKGLRATPPGPPEGWEEGERVRQAIAGYAPVAWVAMIPLVLLVPAWRRGLAQTAFIVALLCATAWWAQPRNIVWPNVSISQFHGLEATGAWGWVLAMNIVSAGIYAWAIWSRPRRLEPVCPTCKYDLTGNVSGICPECGNRVPMWVKLLLNARSGKSEKESGDRSQESEETGTDDSPESER